MKRYWVDIDGDDETLWAHEFKKHGMVFPSLSLLYLSCASASASASESESGLLQCEYTGVNWLIDQEHV